ncbi:ATP-binding protein [Vibrio aquimaris]|nr:ATP-binding protein [Vibrio aquimaris]
MVLKLIIVRGLPGSGKSTLAKTLGMNHYEADMYFINEHNEYQFNPDDIAKAHSWCKRMVRKSLKNKQSVVVANTFVMKWEIIPYFKMARQYGAEFEVIECNGNYENIHGVDAKTIADMKARWQKW